MPGEAKYTLCNHGSHLVVTAVSFGYIKHSKALRADRANISHWRLACQGKLLS